MCSFLLVNARGCHAGFWVLLCVSATLEWVFMSTDGPDPLHQSPPWCTAMFLNLERPFTLLGLQTEQYSVGCNLQSHHQVALNATNWNFHIYLFFYHLTLHVTLNWWVSNWTETPFDKFSFLGSSSRSVGVGRSEGLWDTSGRRSDIKEVGFRVVGVWQLIKC